MTTGSLKNASEAEVNAASKPQSPTPKPGTEADANRRPSDVDRAVRNFRGQTAIEPTDIDFRTNPDPRLPGGPVDKQPQQQNQQEAPAAAKAAGGIKIVYRGKEEEIAPETAATQLQQFRNIQDNYGPYLSVAKQFREAGYTPEQGAQMIVDAVKNAVRKAGGSEAEASAAGAAAAGAAKQVTEQVAAGGQPAGKPAQQTQQGGRALTEEEADTATKEFFAANGQTPTPAVFEQMKNVLMFGSQARQIATMMPDIVKDVTAFKQQTEQSAMRTRNSEIDARAAQVADELKINDEATFGKFQQWLQQKNGRFPGFAKAALTSADAMEDAIRDFAAIELGKKAVEQAQALQGAVASDRARAGGEMVPSPGGGGRTAGDGPEDFNSKMLTEL